MVVRVGLLVFAVAIIVLGFSLVGGSDDSSVSASTLFAPIELETDGFARAIDPRDWSFPIDHGAHNDFQTEWWYYTGNLQTPDERHFGFQFTIFRRAVTPTSPQTDSEWRSNQVYFAHFALSDIEGEAFYHDQRFSRAGADLAGAMVDPTLRIWIEDWVIEAQDDEATRVSIQAQADDYAIDLTLEQSKAPALQGQNGLSPKSNVPGNASYYYSLSRLETTGTIYVDGDMFDVSGNAWMDHEFSTSALGEDALGWDWFGLIFDNGQELMIGQIRQVDGNVEPAFGGLWVYPDGSTQYLNAEDFTIMVTDQWESPHTSAVYPAAWDVRVQLPDERVTFQVAPLIPDQELHSNGIIYWEGAVEIIGDVSGYGYAELTGYADAMTGRF